MRYRWGMPNVSPPPHRKTVFLAVISIGVAIFFGTIGYFKVAGQTSTINGPVNVGPGSAGINNGTINNGPPTPNAEAVRRSSLINELLMEYVMSHDGIQPTLDGRYEQAEGYINERLAAKSEPFRFDAKTRSAKNLK
jgi:hypothetical protein